MLLLPLNTDGMSDRLSELQMTAIQAMWVLTPLLNRLSIRQLLIGGVFLVLLDASLAMLDASLARR